MATEFETDQRPASRAHVWRMSRLAAEGSLEVIAELAKRVFELESRLAEVETRQLRYVGVHESGRKYLRGELCTHRGNLWHCEADTEDRPGENANWVLAVRKGSDGRDATRSQR